MAQETLSDYAKFHLALDGYNVYYYGSLMYRWQLFVEGITPEQLFANAVNGYKIEPKEDVFGEVA